MIKFSSKAEAELVVLLEKRAGTTAADKLVTHFINVLNQSRKDRGLLADITADDVYIDPDKRTFKAKLKGLFQ